MRRSHAIIIAALVLVPPARLDAFPFWIHEQIIREALEPYLSPEDLDVVAQSTNSVESDQSTCSAYMHGMSAHGQPIEEARRQTAAFIRAHRAGFIVGDGRDALEHLGIALHPVVDMFSPVHEGHQSWRATGCLITLLEGMVHAQSEAVISPKRFDRCIEAVRHFYLDAAARRLAGRAVDSVAAPEQL